MKFMFINSTFYQKELLLCTVDAKFGYLQLVLSLYFLTRNQIAQNSALETRRSGCFNFITFQIEDHIWAIDFCMFVINASFRLSVGKLNCMWGEIKLCDFPSGRTIKVPKRSTFSIHVFRCYEQTYQNMECCFCLPCAKTDTWPKLSTSRISPLRVPATMTPWPIRTGLREAEVWDDDVVILHDSDFQPDRVALETFFGSFLP